MQPAAGTFCRAEYKGRTFPAGQRCPGELPIVTYQGDERKLDYEIGVGARVAVNVNGKELFEPLFGAIQQLYGELHGQQDGSSSLQKLEDALDTVLSQVSQVGAKQNRVALARERLQDLRLNVTELLGESQNIDYAETIMHPQGRGVYLSDCSSGGSPDYPTVSRRFPPLTWWYVWNCAFKPHSPNLI